MMDTFLADGEARLVESPAFQAQLAKVRKQLDDEFAERMKAARFWQRIMLGWQKAAKLHLERQKLLPSRYSLY